MAKLIPVTYQTTIPPDATFETKQIRKNGRRITVRIARFRQRGGRLVEAIVQPNGKATVKSPVWYGRIRFADGIIGRIKLLENKEASRQLLVRLQTEEDQRAAGVFIEYAVHCKRPLIGAPGKLPKRKPERDKWNRVTKRASELHWEDMENAIAGSHLADYRTYMESRGCTEKTVRETIPRIRQVCIACDFRFPADVNATRFREFVRELIDAGRRYATINTAIANMKGLFNWMAGEAGRLPKNPLAGVRKLNEEADPGRRIRRLWTSEGFAMLIAAAENGPRTESILGPDRAMLYVLAAWSGYRRKELAALTLGNVSLV